MGRRRSEAESAVVGLVAHQQHGPVSSLPGQAQAPTCQVGPDAFASPAWQDSERPKQQRRHIAHQDRPIADQADDLRLIAGHQGQRPDRHDALTVAIARPGQPAWAERRLQQAFYGGGVVRSLGDKLKHREFLSNGNNSDRFDRRAAVGNLEDQLVRETGFAADRLRRPNRAKSPVPVVVVECVAASSSRSVSPETVTIP